MSIKETSEYKRLAARHERDAELLEDAQLEVASLQKKLTIQSALVDFQNEAYDALRFHGVDYQKCRVWLEPGNPLEDRSSKMTERQAMKVIMVWLGRMRRDLHAAMKRKAIKEVKKPQQ
jgi:hypothetical protein